jgi:hypothetical protein
VDKNNWSDFESPFQSKGILMILLVHGMRKNMPKRMKQNIIEAYPVEKRLPRLSLHGGY